MDEKAPVAIVGQGALGTFFAAVLSAAGHDVHVVTRRASAAGTVTLAATGEVEASGTVTRRPGLPEAAAWAMVCRRAEETLEAAEAALQHVVPSGGVVLVQNGLTPLEVADKIGHDRCIPAVVGFNAKLVDDSTVRVTSKGPVTLGALGEGLGQVEASLEEGLGSMLPVRVTQNPEGAVWSKWCISCAISGLAVLTGHGLGPVTRRRDGREALVAIVTECVRVAQAEGVQLARVAGPLAPGTLAGPAREGVGGAFRRGVVWMLGRIYGSVLPSAWEAYQSGRDPEIDRLNGVAVERGDRRGVKTPYNRELSSMVQDILEGTREPGLDQLSVLQDRAG